MALLEVASTDDLWEGEMLGVRAGARKVVLLNVDGAVRAYEDRCAHQGVPLSEGRLEGRVLTCGAHYWQYDALSGRGINPASARLVSVPVVVTDDGRILVDAGGGSAGERRDGADGDGADGPGLDDRVGPVLDVGRATDAVVSAIRRENESVQVLDRGSYVRVLVPERCVVSRTAIEDALGAPFELPGDLERIMPSFKGRLWIDDDGVEWAFTPRSREVR